MFLYIKNRKLSELFALTNNRILKFPHQKRFMFVFPLKHIGVASNTLFEVTFSYHKSMVSPDATFGTVLLEKCVIQIHFFQLGAQ